MKLNRLFEDVFMDIDWSLYDDETSDLSGVGEKIYRTANNAAAKWRPKTKDELIAVIKEELKNDNTNLNCIDTSKITSMSQLFDQEDGIHLSEEQQKALDVSEWDVSNVECMGFMFYNCENFNQDLSEWDVRNVRDMDWVFYGCTKFNQNISGWDVRNVRNMHCMFYNCENFNQDLSEWDVRNVRSVRYMFNGCSKLKENGLIPDWYKYK